MIKRQNYLESSTAPRQAGRLHGEGSLEVRAVHRRGVTRPGSAKMGRDRRYQAILPLE